MTPGLCPTRRLVLAAGPVLLLPRVAPAQEAGRTYRIGPLFPFPRGAPQQTMFENLGRLGFVEGRNLAVASSGFGLRTEQFPETAAEFAKDRVDVILAGGAPAIRAAQQATATIPILGFTDDMVGSGLVSSMARPGGNTSGISLLATELDGKRQELLIEMTADAHRIAALVDADTTAPERLQQLQEAAEARGIEVALHRVTKPEEIAGAMEAAKAAGAAGLKCWRRRCCSPSVSASWNERPRCVCRPYTNGRRSPSRAAFPPMVRASC